MKTMKKFLVLAAMAVLTMSCLTGCGSKKIDVLSGLDVEFSGVDGKGEAEVVFPNSDLAYGFIEDLVVAGDEKLDSIGDLARLEEFCEAVTYEVSPSEGLSNGDEVTVEITVDSKKLKELGYSAKSTSAKFTVEGLATPVEIDPFADFDVTYSGISPNATAEFESSREMGGTTVRYECENNGSLRLGESVTIKASVRDSEMYILTEETKDFPVEGVDSYISQAEDIPDGLWEEMKSQAQKEWENRSYNDYDLWEYKNLEYIGYEFGSRSPDFPYAPANICYLVYEVTANDGEEDFSFYFYYKFENLLLRQDGSLEAKVPGFGSRPSLSEMFQHNGIQIFGYETLEALKDGTAKNESAHDLKVNLP